MNKTFRFQVWQIVLQYKSILHFENVPKPTILENKFSKGHIERINLSFLVLTNCSLIPGRDRFIKYSSSGNCNI
jgi:hypothetical protein